MKNVIHTLCLTSIFAVSAFCGMFFGAAPAANPRDFVAVSQDVSRDLTEQGENACRDTSCRRQEQTAFARSDEQPFEIRFDSDEGSFVYKDDKIQPTDYLVADEIFNRKINATIVEKRAMMTKAVRAGASYERAVTMCMPLSARTVNEAEAKINTPPVDAQILFNPDRKPAFTIKRDKTGRRVNREKTFELIYASVMHGGNDRLKLPVEDVEALITADMLTERTYTRAEFSTNFDEGNAERTHNIALALQKVNGTVLNPEEEFSFNAAVGARSEKNGFKQAKIIMDGEYVLGYGGGVCQASTTIYNAALRAGMEITMVRNHSLTSSYVEPSLDAMVNSSSSDLKFKNPLDTPVYIAARVVGATAFVKIYGIKNEYKIVPKSRVLSVIEPQGDEEIVDKEHKYLPAESVSGDTMRIRNAKEGVKSEAYLEYYKDNLLVRRVKIRSDTYKAVRGIVMIAP